MILGFMIYNTFEIKNKRITYIPSGREYRDAKKSYQKGLREKEKYVRDILSVNPYPVWTHTSSVRPIKVPPQGLKSKEDVTYH